MPRAHLQVPDNSEIPENQDRDSFSRNRDALHTLQKESDEYPSYAVRKDISDPSRNKRTDLPQQMPCPGAVLLKTNYKGMGERDKTAFEQDFYELLDLAEEALRKREQKRVNTTNTM